MVSMRNADVFERNPLTASIPNDGVAKIAEPRTERDWEVLRYELQYFVCEGEYHRGLERMLSAFLANFKQPQQKAAWVSGFYGSGKSHLVRVLEQLWRDRRFPDGTRAQSVVNLPPDIVDRLDQLRRLAQSEGGLWSAAGSLAAGSGSVRLGLLSILFRSAGLPEQYPAACLALWLKQNGRYKRVVQGVQSRGKNFKTELRNMYVSEALADSLLEAMPNWARDLPAVHDLLQTQFPNVEDISDENLFGAIEDVLTLQSTTKGKFPLTLLIFDELQQFIADETERTLRVQNVVEGCSHRFGGNVLFVGTGQSGLEGNTELQKLQGRFSIRVTLSDIDVEKVVREVVLRKKPDGVPVVREVLDAASGEIDRHLAGTAIGPRNQDIQQRVADYPILPVRRRLWESMLRAVDSTGTQGQLRTQLRIVHDATRKVAKLPVGAVVPSDEIYWQLEDHMIQSHTLMRDIQTSIKELDDGSADGRLKSRICALIFMLSRLEGSGSVRSGIKANANALSDLLVDDLNVESGHIRQKIPTLLKSLADDGLLILVGEEYRLQTRESAEWNEDYTRRFARIRSNNSVISETRSSALRDALDEILKAVRIEQGESRTPRLHELHYGPDAPFATGRSIPVWVQDEWSAVSEGSVREEARRVGAESPTVFVFLKRMWSDELREALARYLAAKETLDFRAIPQSPEGMEARAVIQSHRDVQYRAFNAMIDEIVKNARIYQGGGNEVLADAVAPALEQAIRAAATRLFPKFPDADSAAWDNVIGRAQEGSPDPLSLVGHRAGVENHTVCQAIRNSIGSLGKRGSEVLTDFENPPFGWPRDAILGASLSLLSGGFLRATYQGEGVTARQVSRQSFSATEFIVEGFTVSAAQRVQVRKIASVMKIPETSGKEAITAVEILQRLVEEARSAGGEAPLPAVPDRSLVEGLLGMSGNEQVVNVAENAGQLLSMYDNWSNLAKSAHERMPQWGHLLRFLQHASSLPIAIELRPQINAIMSERTLLNDPDPVPPLMASVTDALRSALLNVHKELVENRDRLVSNLLRSDNWANLGEHDRERILQIYLLGSVSEIDVGDRGDLMNLLNESDLKSRGEQITLLMVRVEEATEEVSRVLQPEAVKVNPPSAILSNREDVEGYINGFREELLSHIDEGPVRIG